MATMLPPVFGAAFEFDVVLLAQSDNQIKTSPTIAAGDFVVSKANGATANLTTTPSESPASSGIVRVQLSATEMEADKLTVKYHDASGAEWHDGAVTIFTSGQTFDALPAEIAEAQLIFDWESVTGTIADRSTLNALRLLRNKWSVAAGTLTVTEEDDTTTAWTATVTGTEGADPITTVDPA